MCIRLIWESVFRNYFSIYKGGRAESFKCDDTTVWRACAMVRARIRRACAWRLKFVNPLVCFYILNLSSTDANSLYLLRFWIFANPEFFNFRMLKTWNTTASSLDLKVRKSGIFQIRYFWDLESPENWSSTNLKFPKYWAWANIDCFHAVIMFRYLQFWILLWFNYWRVTHKCITECFVLFFSFNSFTLNSRTKKKEKKEKNKSRQNTK